MTEITKLSARTYSRLGQRGAIFGMAVCDAAKEDSQFILLTADLALLSGMDRYVKMYPEQFVNVGIAEQNLLGITAGLSAEGYHTVASTYATFITMRSCEQLRHYFGYMRQKSVIIGSGAGLCQGYAGNTHYTIEDISMVRAIPNISVVSPADAGAAVKIFEMALKQNHTVYIRLTGNLNCPIVYKEDHDFELGKSICVRPGKDVTIFATGTMVSHAIQAADLLAEEGIDVCVIDMYSIKPIDKEAIRAARSSKLLVSIEEHNVLGGLGSAVAEVMTEETGMPRLLRLGINDEFNLAASYEHLLGQNSLMPQQIAADIQSAYQQ